MLRYLLPLLCMAVCAAQESFDVSGRFAPPGRGSVTLYATRSPFSVSTLSEEDGRFSFKKIDAGSYTVAVFLPDLGEARQTVEIGPGTADSKRRVMLNL